MKIKQIVEVSLGDYRRKASLSKAGAQIDKVFGSPENREKADSIIAKRDRGLARADVRGRANAEKLKQKAEQDRIASLRAAKDRLDDIKARLAELEAKFDSYYEYSDDHGEWTRQRELKQKIMAMKKHIADIEALDEADDNFGQPATMMNASPQAKAQAQSDDYEDPEEAVYDDDWDKMIDRFKELAGKGPLVSIRGDDGITRNVPKKDLNK
jgi:TolA-binding protein